MARAKADSVEKAIEESVVENTSNETKGPTQCMYVGPNLFTRGIMQYQVFVGDLPHEFEDFANERSADILHLVVPVDSHLGQVLKEVATPGTLLQIYYDRVLGAYAKEVNEHGI